MWALNQFQFKIEIENTLYVNRIQGQFEELHFWQQSNSSCSTANLS